MRLYCNKLICFNREAKCKAETDIYTSFRPRSPSWREYRTTGPITTTTRSSGSRRASLGPRSDAFLATWAVDKCSLRCLTRLRRGSPRRCEKRDDEREENAYFQRMYRIEWNGNIFWGAMYFLRLFVPWNSVPNRKCWTTGSFVSTSPSYKRSKPRLTRPQLGS